MRCISVVQVQCRAVGCLSSNSDALAIVLEAKAQSVPCVVVQQSSLYIWWNALLSLLYHYDTAIQLHCTALHDIAFNCIPSNSNRMYSSARMQSSIRPTVSGAAQCSENTSITFHIIPFHRECNPECNPVLGRLSVEQLWSGPVQCRAGR